MNTLAALLDALNGSPGDELAWLALADWLEEQDRAAQAELLRLHRGVRLAPDRKANRPAVERSRGLRLGGVKPVWPALSNTLGMELSLIPQGTFWMGGRDDEPEFEQREGPVHEVTLTRPFYLAT